MFGKKRKGGGKDTEFSSPDYNYKKNKIRSSAVFFKEFHRIEKQYEKRLNLFSQDEILFGRMIEKKKLHYALDDKIMAVLKPEEIENSRYLEAFFQKFGGAIVNLATKRRQMNVKMERVLGEVLKIQNVDTDKIDSVNSEYQKIMDVFENTYKKISQKEEDLRKAEKKTQNIGEMKKKEKSKKQEEKKVRLLEKEWKDFENLQKLAMYTEAKTNNELEYLNEKCDNDFVGGMCQVIEEYKQFFETGAKLFQKLEKELNIKEKIKNYKPVKKQEKVEIKVIRPEFLPISMKKQFGVPVDEVMKRPNENGDIPQACELMIKYVLDHRNMEGIFRKAGKKEKVEYLKRHIDSGSIQNFDEVRNPYTVSVLLKHYIRELPHSFAPFNEFKKILAMRNDRDKNNFIQRVWKNMTQGNQTMFYRCFHLFKLISDNHEKNKMKPNNISICMATNVIKHPGFNDPKMIQQIALITKDIQEVFLYILEHYKEIFVKPRKPKYKKEGFGIDEELIAKMKKKVLGGKLTIGGLGRTKDKDRNKDKDNKEDNGDSGGEKIERSDIVSFLTGGPMGRTPGGNKKGGDKKGVRIKRGSAPKKNLPTVRKEIDDIEDIDFYEVFNDSKVKTICALGNSSVVSGDESGFVKVWDLAENGLQSPPSFGVKEHKRKVTSVIALNSRTFVSSSEDGTVRVWKIGSPKSVKLLRFHSPIYKLYFDEEMPVFLVVEENHIISVDKFNFNIKTKYDNGHVSNIDRCFYSFGNVYTLSEEDGFMMKWDFNSSKPVEKLEVKNEKMNYATPSSSPKVKVVSCLTSGKYVSWTSTKSPAVIDTFKKMKIKRLFELNKKKDYFILVFEYPKYDMISLAIGYCGLVSSFPVPGTHIIEVMKYGEENDNKYVFWDESHKIRTCTQTSISKTFEGHTDKINAVIPFFKGKLFASCSDDRSIRIWEIEEGDAKKIQSPSTRKRFSQQISSPLKREKQSPHQPLLPMGRRKDSPTRNKTGFPPRTKQTKAQQSGRRQPQRRGAKPSIPVSRKAPQQRNKQVPQQRNKQAPVRERQAPVPKIKKQPTRNTQKEEQLSSWIHQKKLDQGRSRKQSREKNTLFKKKKRGKSPLTDVGKNLVDKSAPPPLNQTRSMLYSGIKAPPTKKKISMMEDVDKKEDDDLKEIMNDYKDMKDILGDDLGDDIGDDQDYLDDYDPAIGVGDEMMDDDADDSSKRRTIEM